jgi:Ceramidase
MLADLVSGLCYSAQMSRRILGLLVFMLASLLGLLLLPPIVQNQNYHDFADQRTLFGIPNFWNVVSNIPFIGIGAVGLWQFGRSPATMLLFLGIFLTGFGSAYYHLEPNDQTLFWDRLPMAISFMAILAIAIVERVDTRAGAILLWPMTAIGVFSMLLWHWTGDLRLYAWVQFFPCLALPLIFILFAPRFSGTIYWLIAAALYALAKLFEFYDSTIYSAGTILSRLRRAAEIFSEAPAALGHECRGSSWVRFQPLAARVGSREVAKRTSGLARVTTGLITG